MSKSNKTSSWFVYYRYSNSSGVIDAQRVICNIPYPRLTVSAIEYIYNDLRCYTRTDSVVICNIIRVY